MGDYFECLDGATMSQLTLDGFDILSLINLAETSGTSIQKRECNYIKQGLITTSCLPGGFHDNEERPMFTGSIYPLDDRISGRFAHKNYYRK